MNFSPFILYKIKVVILTIIGCIIPSYIIYIRLIMDRFPREIFTDISVIQLFIYMDLFLIFLFLSISTGYYLYREKYPPRRKINIKILKILIEKYKNFLYLISLNYNMSLLYFDKFLKNTVIEKWLGQEFFFMNMLITFQKLFGIYLVDYFKWVTIIFIMLPKGIILITLGIDIFIFEELRYFYILSPIYLIPLIFEYYVYTIKAKAITCLKQSSTMIKITKISTGEEVSATEFIRNKFQYSTPYKQGYHIYIGEEENYKKFISDHYYVLTERFLAHFSHLSEEQLITLAKKEMLAINDHYGDTLLIAVTFTTTKQKYTKIFNLIILIGYAISWGYIFIRSAYMYI